MPAKIAFNPYEVLGIERGCTEKEIQKAYRQQCLRWHPDKNLDNKEEGNVIDQHKIIFASYLQTFVKVPTGFFF